ncbi:hypothetical protein GCM10022243_12280 [Saccharothrix violaceirubra]|uniref:Putative ABC transport system permease protein n=1 Tax=Saccharothrix violaceirubra TaxID=413306 RepID=A0A7W7T9X0_9PSEU|nr:ABC transporter permease [Saccharothrix violaceirubra]MBB4968727.1 putative ABC transport system permease protein [Saccharothrix violaceirubra]
MPVRAAVRVTAQLAAVSAVLTAVLASLPLTAAFLLVMAGVATATSAGRTKAGRRGAWVGVAILAGTLPTLVVLVLSGLVPMAGITLVPASDQTRTVGLVTLPGAFVGMPLGGSPVWQAGVLQLVVLLALLVVEGVAIVVVVELVASGLVRRSSPAGELRLT